MTPDEQKLNEMFPGWRSTVRDPAFSAWLSKQSTLMQKRCYSERYEDAAMALEKEKILFNTLSGGTHNNRIREALAGGRPLPWKDVLAYSGRGKT